MEFSPFNKTVKLCLQAMNAEEKGNTGEAAALFLQAWNEAENDFEKFLAAHYLARQQAVPEDKLKWLETALEYALKSEDPAVKSALPSLYLNMAGCFESLNDPGRTKHFLELAETSKNRPADIGPFYHGTKAELKTGDMLNPGSNSNYRSELKMNHI